MSVSVSEYSMMVVVGGSDGGCSIGEQWWMWT